MHRPGAFENRNKKRPALEQAGYSQQPCLVEKISPYYFVTLIFMAIIRVCLSSPLKPMVFVISTANRASCQVIPKMRMTDFFSGLPWQPALVGRARTRQPGSAPAFRRLPDSLARLIQAPSPSQCKRGRFIQVRLHNAPSLGLKKSFGACAPSRQAVKRKKQWLRCF